MVGFSEVPNVFFGGIASLDLLAGISAFLIAFFGFKIYNYTGERKYHWFSVAFSMISFSFLTSAIVHFLIYFDFRNRLSELFTIIGYGVISLYIIFLIIAHILLLFVATETTSKKMVLFLLILSFTTIFTSADVLKTFFLFQFLILLFVAFSFFEKFTLKTTFQSLLIFLSFALLSISQGLFLSTFFSQSLKTIFYLFGQIFQVASYLVFLIVMLKIILPSKRFKSNYVIPNQHERKKKQA